MSVHSLGERRFERADCAQEVSVTDTLHALLARIERGEETPESVIIVTITRDDSDYVTVDAMHGGRARTIERIGALTYTARRLGDEH